jgi:hypothetical protein
MLLLDSAFPGRREPFISRQYLTRVAPAILPYCRFVTARHDDFALGSNSLVFPRTLRFLQIFMNFFLVTRGIPDLGSYLTLQYDAYCTCLDRAVCLFYNWQSLNRIFSYWAVGSLVKTASNGITKRRSLADRSLKRAKNEADRPLPQKLVGT